MLLTMLERNTTGKKDSGYSFEALISNESVLQSFLTKYDLIKVKTKKS